jgi:hypothetical protein
MSVDLRKMAALYTSSEVPAGKIHTPYVPPPSPLLHTTGASNSHQRHIIKIIIIFSQQWGRHHWRLQRTGCSAVMARAFTSAMLVLLASQHVLLDSAELGKTPAKHSTASGQREVSSATSRT